LKPLIDMFVDQRTSWI